MWVTADNRMYLAEAANCRIRRVTPANVAAQQLSCSTRLVDVLRPAGCAMYDPPVDQLDVMVRNYRNYVECALAMLCMHSCHLHGIP